MHNKQKPHCDYRSIDPYVLHTDIGLCSYELGIKLHTFGFNLRAINKTIAYRPLNQTSKLLQARSVTRLRMIRL